MRTRSPRRYIRPADAETILQTAGTTLSVPEAGALLGVTETVAYQLVRKDEFPVPVLRMGRQIRVPTAAVRRVLGLADEQQGGAA